MSEEAGMVAVVIPAFNAPEVGQVVAGLPALVDRIIIVDDASVPPLTLDHGDARVRVCRRRRNGGVGDATMTGFRVALDCGADILVKMDADGQMDPWWLPTMLTEINHGADLVKGVRYKGRGPWPWTRRFGTWALSRLAGLGLSDVTNGYLALSRSAAQRLLRCDLEPRYGFELSLLFAAARLNLRITQIHMLARYPPGVTSHLNLREVLRSYPRLFLREWGRRRRASPEAKVSTCSVERARRRG